MGGKAFSSGSDPLSTPRMSKEVYDFVKKNVRSLLSGHFERVETAIEAPGKTLYGDVDFKAANPNSDLPEPPMESLALILGASRWISAKPLAYNFALPWPKIAEDRDGEIILETSKNAIGDEDGKDGVGEGPQDHEDSALFVQVDLHICKNPSELEWALFYEAHGDLCNILGSTIRKQGLTLNNAGLHIRIAPIEKVNRKRSMVLLSSDPNQVLDFFKMDRARWRESFQSVDQLFDYVTTCRFFHVPYREKNEGAQCEDEKDVDAHFKSLNANDRRRLKGRALFKQWFEEYVPALREKGLFHVDPISRESTTDMALRAFGDAPRAEYNARLFEWQKEKEKEVLKGIVRKAVPTSEGYGEVLGRRWPHYRSNAIKGLIGIVLEGNAEAGVALGDDAIKEDGFYDLDKVKDFVKMKWRAVGDSMWFKNQERSAMALRKRREMAAFPEQTGMKEDAEESGKVVG